MKVILLVTAYLAAFVAAAAAAEKPNIVVIMTDDQTDVGDMAVMDYTLRAIGDEGATFTSSFTNFPLCCPSRASFLTGQAAHNHGVTENELPYGGYRVFEPQQNDNLGVWLQAAGYRTGFIGKFMNGYNGPNTAPLPGWDDWRALITPSGSDSGHYYDYLMNENGRMVTYGHNPGEYLTDVLTKQAVRFIAKSAALDKPFVLYVGHHAPHEPAIPAPRHVGAFKNRPVPHSPNYNEANVNDKPRSAGIDERMSNDVRKEVSVLYRSRLETLLSVDESVETIMEALREFNLLSDTYIIFTSDNGYMLGEHRFPASKSQVYEESLRVPLLIRGPNLPKGVAFPQLVNNLDMAATVVDLAGAKPSHPLDGVSLLPLMRDPKMPWRTALLAEGRIGGETTYSAVRTVDSVYVEYTSRRYGNEYEFYDLREDPYELRNLGANRERTALYQPLLDRLRDCVGDACFVTDAAPAAHAEHRPALPGR